MKMSRWIGIIVLGTLLTLSLAGCKKGEQEQTDANETAAGQLKEKAGQAMQGATDLLAEQKDKLLAASQEQLTKLEQKINGFLSETGPKDQQKLAALSQQFQEALGEARRALEKAKESGLDAWQQAKPTVETAVEKVQRTHDQVMAFLKTQAQKETQENMDELNAMN
jgi:ElaB/YqjD/DUF883 family membrane-anchored ribosome-binding protein